MCTVTYLPINKDEFILTSNRDVPFAREKALEPMKYIENGIELNYPKDGKAGGSWIGSSSKNRVLCILNGGFVNHIPKESYKKSRGKIVVELLKCNQIEIELNNIDLIGIEPFTLIIVDWNDKLKLFEFVWDGDRKHKKLLTQAPYIWSSSTLYSKEVRRMRLDWFIQWQKNNKFTKNNILKFHNEAGVGNSEIDVKMRRQKGGTVSITTIVKDKSKLEMDYTAVED